jgi:histidine triad (HIT) family protein|tara:strand:- start:2379 stop:2789 length:411 start_codon:yes stop_codon:yes gene_type:complete
MPLRIEQIKYIKKMYNKNNIFYKIIHKEIPATIIYEDEKILAFNDINKAAPIHVLIIPKKEYINHSDFIEKASNDDIAYFFKKTNEIIKSLNIENDSYRIISNIGPDANQTIFHYHIHILGGQNLGPLISSDNLLR